MNAVLTGLGIAVPDQVMENVELAARLDTTDEWVRTRTGIVARRIAHPRCATVDLATAAAMAALDSAGACSIDALLVATTTPDRLVPCTAPEVAARLGYTGLAAFDVNGGCTGFVHGLAVADGLIAAGIAEQIAVIGAETLSRITDPTDRSTAVLFGDGAGAVVLRRGERWEAGCIGPFDLGSDGAGADLLQVPAGGSRLPATSATVADRLHYLQMDGRVVYRHAVEHMTGSSEAVLQRAGMTVSDVDWLVAHQANVRILQAVAKRLGFPPDRCIINIDRYGNTSAASIPLALADAVPRPGDRMLLVAFGAGFTWGATLLTWPNISIATAPQRQLRP
jgi:3-oxoacyl-[acyl-carrier-protein] synthase-3